MEINLELKKAVCKICLKSFSSGRALGGHMRTHAHSSFSEAERTEKEERSRGQVGFGAGYDLRENPKKTWRLSDFVGEGEGSYSKNCKDCGREFPSWKALFGHMRSHNARTSPPCFEAEDVDEEGSRRGKRDSPESLSDDYELLPPSEVPKKKRGSKRASPDIAAATTYSSSSITDYEPEQEEVAISLMMLSRDIGGYLTAAESSDKNSVVMEEDFVFEEDSGDKFRRKKALASADLGNPFNGFNAHEAELGSRYQCTTCNKSFHSYHALGGHRASHKRIRSCCMSSTEHPAAIDHTPSSSSKKFRTHKCVICGKVFSSSQALGGHKRSHLVSNGSSGDQQMLALSQLLDLNLPASFEEGSSNLKPYTSVESLKQEQAHLSLLST